MPLSPATASLDRLACVGSCSDLAAGDNQCGAPVKESSLYIGLGEVCPPQVGFLFREDADDDSPGHMSTQQELEKIVRNRDGVEGNRDVGLADLAEEARKTPADPTVFHPIEALAARYQNEDFWRRSMTEGDDDSPQE